MKMIRVEIEVVSQPILLALLNFLYYVFTTKANATLETISPTIIKQNAIMRVMYTPSL